MKLLGFLLQWWVSPPSHLSHTPGLEHYWAISKTSSKHLFALNQLPSLLSACQVRNQVSTIAFEIFWNIVPLSPASEYCTSLFLLHRYKLHPLPHASAPSWLPEGQVCYLLKVCMPYKMLLGHHPFHRHFPWVQRMVTYPSTNPSIHLPTQSASHLFRQTDRQTASQPPILEMFNMHYGCWSLCCVQGISLPAKQWPLLSWILQTMETSFRKTHL